MSRDHVPPYRLDDGTVHIVDDRSLVENPSGTLRDIQRARDRRMIIAARDVGSNARSLSLLPLVEPDIIVLAPSLTAAQPSAKVARAAHVLAAQAERTGAVIVASGVDSDRQRTAAMSLGATFGLGALFHESESPSMLDMTAERHSVSSTWSTPGTTSRSPFEIASADSVVKTSRKSLLVEMSTHIEWQAGSAGEETMVLGTFQHARHFGGKASTRWHSLAERTAYAGVCGVGMPDAVDSLIHQSPLDVEDPLTDEWNVVVLGPHFCCVLSARDLHHDCAEPDRTFDYVVSHDRSITVRCAKAILQRFGAGGGTSAGQNTFPG